MLYTNSHFYLSHTGVGTVGADDEIEVHAVFLAHRLGTLLQAGEVDGVRAAVLVRGDVDGRHETVDSVGALPEEIKKYMQSAFFRQTCNAYLDCGTNMNTCRERFLTQTQTANVM